MLRAEAAWIGAALQRLPSKAFPLLNLGSGTGHFRRIDQPWIHDLVFRPLEASGRAVVHVDVRAAEGVDEVADVTSPDGLATVLALSYGSVLASNILEHLPSPEDGALALLAIAQPGNTLVVTCPRQFPPHPDPIDNGFRPRPAELAALFGAGAACHEAVEIRDRLLLSLYAEESTRGRIGVAAALLRPWVNPPGWRRLAAWSGRRARAAGVVLERVPNAESSITGR